MWGISMFEDKEWSTNEKKALDWCEANGFKASRVRLNLASTTFCIAKNGIVLQWKVYNDPKIKVESQMKDFMKLYSMEAEVRKRMGIIRAKKQHKTGA